jgi:putative oxidoreductase
VGATRAAHGTQKLFGWFGGGGIEGTAGGMHAMGFHPSKPSAVLAGLGEAGGGLLLALGLATPVGGAAAASTMVAAGAVHKPAGFFVTEGGYEYAGMLGLIGTALAVGGPGHYSLDRLLDDRLDRPSLAAASLGLLGTSSAAVVVRRNRALAAAGPAAAGGPRDAGTEVTGV